MHYDLFISYNSGDADEVQYVTQKLDAFGITYWIDRNQLLAGEPLLKGIEHGLEAAATFLFCLGRSGVGPWQESEVRVALQLALEKPDKRIILLILPSGPAGPIRNLGAPALVRTLRYLDFRAGFDQEYLWLELVKAIKGEEAPAGVVKPKAVARPTTGPPLRRAVSIALIRRDAVLLVKRATSQRTGAGLWQLPGGKIRPGETPTEAALREAEEETGFRPSSDSLHEITELAEVWLDKTSGEAMLMRLYWSPAPAAAFNIAAEFEDHIWAPISALFSDPTRVYFGATTHLLRVLRRFFLLHTPLSALASFLEDTRESQSRLPQELPGISLQSTQLLYSLLSLFGFLDDRGSFGPASILSPSLVKTLSAWALTQGQIFEPQGADRWYKEAVRRGAQDEVDRYRDGLFEEHESLLGLLSYRLSKALSRRTVCDLLILAKDTTRNRHFILLRWDFFARKFQVPAKGLELFEVAPHENSAAAEYVVSERLDPELVHSFSYSYLGSLETAHVSAGSLDDGPLMRKYEVLVYRLSPKQLATRILNLLDSLNRMSVVTLSSSPVLDTPVRKNLKFYLWCDLQLLMADRFSLLERKVQGFDEILQHLGVTPFEPGPADLDISQSTPYLPIVTIEGASHGDILQFAMSEG